MSAASDGQPRETGGVIYIECRKHSAEPSEYLVSFGGHKDRRGAFYIGKPIGFDALTALLRQLGVPGSAIQTALQVLMAEPLHSIPDVILTPATLRALGL
jgi:hypothetical protein